MIGILGGTFDPVHLGHLRTALEVRDVLGLEEIRLIPCRLPPHRPKPLATPGARTRMLNAAIEGHDGFVVDERELSREGPSYMLDTLVSLRKDFASQGLCLLVGMDAFRGLGSWHRWRELLNHCHMIVMTRSGAQLPESGELGDFIRLHRVHDGRVLREQAAGLLLFQQVSRLEISGTHIRRLLAEGGDASFLMPDSVLAIINEQGLYPTGKVNEQ
jgi:nicotinate-nucleotide adenylyltransferase